MTDLRAEEVDLIVENYELSVDVMMKKIGNIENQGKKEYVEKKIESTDEEERYRNLIKKQSAKLEEQILQIKSQNLGRVGNVFKMRDAINGPKKGGQEATAIRNPQNNELIVSNEEIKEVTLKYCVDNLTKQPEDSSVVKGLEIKRFLHELRMEEADDEEFDICKEDFGEVINKFAKKKSKSYDFLLKAGNNFKESIYRLCRKMILNEHFPHGFRKTVLFMIWKQKAPAEVLSNNRFIHMKDGYLPRTCEALVVNKMKDKLIKSSSKYQVGGQPGHSPEEHIYSIQSLWVKLEAEGDGMILTLVDIVAFFDRENIFDIMQTLHEIGVSKKAARVWYKLNEGTEIAVKTAGGLSETAVVGDCIGQGTAGGALVSLANLDHGLKMRG